MKRTFSITAIVLIAVSLLSRCAARGSKPASDAVAGATKNSGSQNVQAVPPQKTPEAASSATLSSEGNAPKILEAVFKPQGSYTAKPVDIICDDWLTKFAGGRKNTIAVRIGEVAYSTNKPEASIELVNGDKRITLVENSMSAEYDDKSQKLKRVTLDFLTGKKLEGKEVVKDYSEGKVNIMLIVDYNEDGSAVPSMMYCAEISSKEIPKDSYYKLELKK